MSYPVYIENAELYEEVQAERDRSVRKHGPNAQDSLVAGDPHLLFNLGEEFGEVCKAMTYDQDPQTLRKELVQVAAMACAWIQVLDRSHA